MKATEAFADLRRFGKPVLTTKDAALKLKVTVSAASRVLGRLAAVGLLRQIRHGLWSLELNVDALLLPEYLTAPYPAYISFQSALYFHGMIRQIPRVVYVASLARTRRVTTSLGTYSIHRLAPSFFGGYTTLQDSGIRLAKPEKALLDTLYLSPTRSRLFAHLPELELPDRFSRREARRWLGRVSAAYRRTMVARRLDEILASRGG